MLRIICLGIVASAFVNGALLLVGRGGFGHWFLAMVIALYLGMPGILIGGSIFGLGYRSRLARRIGQVIALAGAVCISAPISLAPGRWMVQHDIAAAERYCDALILQVDDYKREHGSYPHNLSPIRRDPDVPHLARSLSYWSDGSAFRFDMGDPRGIMNFVGYSSADRRWREWH
jgi:hypothetical protein